MSAAPQAHLIAGERLHLHQGPIDLIIGVGGPGREAAFARATRRFEGLLAGLAAELPLLRSPLPLESLPRDPVGRAMVAACAPHAALWVTPMAAVAGAVADAVLAAMALGPEVRKGYVNNGGDIALHLGPGGAMRALSPGGALLIGAADPARGLATSGWRGRSHSLGIADAVTVAAPSAAAADVAATLIANAVDLPGHPAITRRPASDLSPESDLGVRPVTVAVGPLSEAEEARALERGAALARSFVARGLICQAQLLLGRQSRHLGPEETLEKDRLHA
jgi:hypothetical protein